MPVRIVRPQSTGRAPGSARRTVLLTAASGVEAGDNSAPTISHDLPLPAAMARPDENRRSEHACGGASALTRKDAVAAPGDPVVIDLVTRARDGDKRAWDSLVERYAPLIWSICQRRRLSAADAEDVGQSVWLQLVDHLDQIRDPAALPGWLVTTTQRECYRVLRQPGAARYVPDVEDIADKQAATAEQELLAAERHAALREAVGDLSPLCQQLISLLIADPPVPYAEISARLGIAVGSIGPYRSRCLDKLRRHPAIAAMITTCES